MKIMINQFYLISVSTCSPESNLFLKFCNEKISEIIFFSFLKRYGRIILNLFLILIPNKLEILFVSLLKKKADRKIFLSPQYFFINRFIYENKTSINPIYPDNKKFYMGITMDIDYKKDYDHLPYLLDKFSLANIPVTINFITHGDYKINNSFLTEITTRGFEIGLHGDTHNTALAFLPKWIIKKKISRAIDKLGIMPKGFRPPGLSYSNTLLEVLSEFGFQYSSSLTTGISNYKSIQFPYIFKYKDFDLFEVPLFMQDYNFFVNDLYSETSAIEVFRKQILEMKNICGVTLFNLHPMIMKKKSLFLKQLIELLIENKNDAYISTVGALLKSI